MIAWIAPFAGGVVLLAGAWFASARPPALRIAAALVAVVLLVLAWMQFQRWEQAAGKPSLFAPADRAAQRQMAAQVDPVMLSGGAAESYEPVAEDGEPFFPESIDNPFAAGAQPQRVAAANGAPASADLWPSEIALAEEPAAAAVAAEPDPEPAAESVAPAPPEPAPRAAPQSKPPRPARAQPGDKPRRSVAVAEAPRAAAEPLRVAPPPAPEARWRGWRSSEEVIAATPPISEPTTDLSALSTPLRADCSGMDPEVGVCVLVENRLGPDQVAERLQLFIEGRPVGRLDVDGAQPVARLPIRFSHPGRFGYRLVGERETVRGRERINSTGVLIARDGLVYAVRAAPDAPRVFLELAERYR